MSEWITDRQPTREDGNYVYSRYGNICHWSEWSEFRNGEPWKPIPKCEPYMKPKRYKVNQATIERWCVIDLRDRDFVAMYLPTREAAERIAAIYNEVMS